MEIPQKYKMELLGMITAIEMKHDELIPKWIPVSERLPEDNRQVLVYAQSTHFALAKYDEMMEPKGEWKKQWVTFDAWKPYYTIKNVIAWMPLPEPNRGER
jgi:hypothetical protein